MKAKLIGLDSVQSDTIHLESFPVLVGRSEDLALTLNDRWVSRRHCVLEMAEDGELVVRDLESKHGTFVNNSRIEEATLQSGDKLSIGMCTFFVSIEAEAPLESQPSL